MAQERNKELFVPNCQTLEPLALYVCGDTEDGATQQRPQAARLHETGSYLLPVVPPLSLIPLSRRQAISGADRGAMNEER